MEEKTSMLESVVRRNYRLRNASEKVYHAILYPKSVKDFNSLNEFRLYSRIHPEWHRMTLKELKEQDISREFYTTLRIWIRNNFRTGKKRDKVMRNVLPYKRKSNMNPKLAEMAKKGMSYADMGREIGLSRERVRQVYRSNPEYEYTRVRAIAEKASRSESELKAKKKEFMSLATYLKSITLAKAEQEGKHITRTVKCFFSNKYIPAYTLPKYAEIARRHYEAKAQKRKPSLQKLGEGIAHAAYAGVIVRRLKLKPFYKKGWGL